MVVIHDCDDPGQEGVDVVAKYTASAVESIKNVVLPYEIEPNHGHDLRDWINDGNGWSELERLISEAATLDLAEHLNADEFPLDDPNTGRPQIYLETAEHVSVDQGIRALAKSGQVFVRGGQLCHVTADVYDDPRIKIPKGSPHIATMSDAKLRTMLTRYADIGEVVSVDDEPECKPKHPTSWLVGGILKDGCWPGTPRITGVTQTPLIRQDGTILQNPGYDIASGRYYIPARSYPPIPENPTPNDAHEALNTLLAVVSDFPFAKKQYLSAWFAALFTPMCSLVYDDCAPLFLFDAATPGTGKGLLAQSAALIATGRRFSTTPYSEKSEELRKVITSVVLSGERTVLFDNVVGHFGGAALEAAITSTTWSDRILGGSDRVNLPLNVIWYATANNARPTNDMPRRICHIRLESDDARPETRTDFKIKNLRLHIEKQQPELLAASCTILRAWFAGGWPPTSARTDRFIEERRMKA